VLTLGRERSGDDLAGGVIPAHGVDGDHRPGPAAGRARRTVRGASGIGLAPLAPLAPLVARAG
jgi:hypothetical protein